MRRDCLARHSCRWKLDNRNSLSVPIWHSGDTTAVNWGAPVLVKVDRAMGRYFLKLSGVYKGTQSAIAVNCSREHSTRRPSFQRIGSQWSVIISGKSNSDAAAWGRKHSEVSMSIREGVVPASNPRRLHLTRWTQSLSPAKTSYLLGRMSPSITPLGRDCSRGDGLLSFHPVACFFRGDEHGLHSSSGRFWLSPGSLFGVETAVGISIGRSVSSSSDITMAATSSGMGSGMVLLGSSCPVHPACSRWPPFHPLVPWVSSHLHEMDLVYLV